MKVKHSLEIKAKCPVNDSTDTYAMTLEVDRMVKVEDILEAVKQLTKEPIFQEHLTQKLALELCGRVTTVGEHSGVRTECEA